MISITKYLYEVISNIDKSSDLKALSKEICRVLVNDYEYVQSDVLEDTIGQLLQGLQNKNINGDTVINSIIHAKGYFDTISKVTEEVNTGNDGNSGNTSNTGNSSRNTTKSERQSSPSNSSSNRGSYERTDEGSLDEIIDIDTDVVTDISGKYGPISDEISGNKLEVSNSVIASYASSLVSAIASENQEIVSDINDIKPIIIDTLSEIPGIDNEIKNVDLSNYSFDDIGNLSKKIDGKRVHVADKAFFEQCGCTVNGNIVTVGEYTYDLKSHILSANGVKVKTLFYIPEGITNYSHVNTLTTFSDISSDTKSSAILVSLGQVDGLKTSQVSMATKFINKVAGTDLTKCQNTITGGSRFGARSLKIAAETGDLYQSIICVNNAVIVKGVNGRGSGKEAFDSVSDLAKLNGKNIYMVSSKEDPNLIMYNGKTEFDKIGNGFSDDSDIRQCYVYTGLELLAKYCPNANVYMITNSNNIYLKEFSASNYHYAPGLWDSIANNPSYAYHKTYNNILHDMCESGLVGCNGYNS